MIIVTALRTHASATKTEELVAGRVGMEAEFHFSREWDGLSKTAVWEAGGVVKDVILSGDPCTVPHECMVEGAELRVGIYGMGQNGSIVIPTVYALVGTVRPGADPSGDESYPPTPDVGEQVLMLANEAMQIAENVQRMADNGEFDGERGPEGPQGERGEQGPEGPQGERGETGFSGVYVGSGDIPAGYNIQIDPEADAAPCFENVTINYTKNLCSLGTVSFERGSGKLPIGTTLLAGETYTLSAEVTSTDTDSALCAVYLISVNGSQLDPKYTLRRGARNSVTFVPPVDCDKISFYASGQAGNSTGDFATFSYIQIEEGEKATYYVPHESAEALSAIDYVARKNTEEFAVVLDEAVEVLTETVESVQPLPAQMQSLMQFEPIPGIFKSEEFENGSITESGANSSNVSRIRTKGFIDVSSYSTIEYDVADGYRFYLVFFGDDTTGTKISNHGWFTGTGSITIPKDAKYFRAQIASTGDATALTAEDYAVVSIKYGYKAMTAVSAIVTKTKWLAIGDSITFGVYSYMNGSSSNTGVTDGWVRRLANALGHDITVMASRGMGYTAAVTGQDPEGGSARISLDTLLTRIEALKEDFNLITMAFGINDYATISQATLNTIEAGLDDAIRRLMTKFPAARFVIITPFNSSRTGDVSTNYAYGYKYSGRSLKDIADLIKSKCESYGIECIYASNGFLINSFNIQTLLPDNTHPSDYGHTLIAKNMAHYLTN